MVKEGKTPVLGCMITWTKRVMLHREPQGRVHYTWGFCGTGHSTAPQEKVRDRIISTNMEKNKMGSVSTRLKLLLPCTEE